MKNEEEIKKLVEEREKKQHDDFAGRKKKRAELCEKLKQLKAAKHTCAEFEQQEIIKQEIKRTESHIDFIDEQRTAKPIPYISQEEFNEINKIITADIKALQNSAAPEIQEHVLAAIELMDKYNDRAKELQYTKDRAWRLLKPEFPGMSSRLNEIGDVNPDLCGWWQAFVWMYYRHTDEAAKIKAAQTSTGASDPWHKH